MNGKTCATSDIAKAWESIDWNKAEAYVKKTANAYRKGSSTGQDRQGEIFAVAAHTLFLWTCFSCKKGNE